FITATVTSASRPASADQISDLTSQAAQISQQLLQEQLQIGGLQQQYQAVAAQVAQAAQEIAQAQGQISLDEAKVRSERTALHKEALWDYMTSGELANDGVTQLFNPDEQTAPSRAQYRESAVGNAAVTIAQLHTDQGVLQSQLNFVQQQQAKNQQREATEGTLLSQSRSTQNQLASRRAQVTGQLASAVAQQQAAQAATAEAAVRAAQAAASSHSTQSSSSTDSAPPATSEGAAPTSNGPSSRPAAPAGGPGASSDPALNAFLQCVVQHESGGDYGVVSPDGQYMGAFQFSQSTWNVAAQLAGLPGLIGVPPNQASKADQDTLAVALYAADGDSPWYDPCNPNA
ncbi:MAG: transglycosylase family protein, partial [Solirubrobacteraceae bacterium]